MVIVKCNIWWFYTPLFCIYIFITDIINVEYIYCNGFDFVFSFTYQDALYQLYGALCMYVCACMYVCMYVW
ncbi:hypothetical protein BZA77DRAFT_319357 [Pyronema omphalodes]|nr:hypothetical protein BZA77DRAFT_319357 [Pyronema omphalodes]